MVCVICIGKVEYWRNKFMVIIGYELVICVFYKVYFSNLFFGGF